VYLLPWVFVVIGAGILVGGIRSLRATSRFERRAVQAPGTVTDLRWSASGSSGRRAFPIVCFALPDGRVVEAAATYGSNPPPAVPGQPVTVMYDPRDPTTFRLPGFLGAGHLFAVLLIVLGAGFMVLGTFVGALFLLVHGAVNG
jgi:hypothetical protein